MKNIFCISTIICIINFTSCKNTSSGNFDKVSDSLKFVQKADAYQEKKIYVFKYYPIGIEKKLIKNEGKYLEYRENAWGYMNCSSVFKYQRMIGYNIRLYSVSKHEFVRELEFIYSKLHKQFGTMEDCNLNEDSIYVRPKFNIYNTHNSNFDITGDAEFTEKALIANFSIISKELK